MEIEIEKGQAKKGTQKRNGMREMEIPLLMTKAVWSTEPVVRQEEVSKKYMAMQHVQTWGVKSQICWMIVDTKPCWASIALFSLLVSNNGLPSLCVARPTITTTPNEIKHLTDITQNNSHE